MAKLRHQWEDFHHNGATTRCKNCGLLRHAKTIDARKAKTYYFINLAWVGCRTPSCHGVVDSERSELEDVYAWALDKRGRKALLVAGGVTLTNAEGFTKDFPDLKATAEFVRKLRKVP